jgi:hypothetical protein
MTSFISSAWAYVNRVCGFDTVDAFPPGHPYARTRWNAAYFDIASDLTPDQIERAICAKIANTPLIFAHIANPTQRMQRALLGAVGDRKHCNRGNAGDLVLLLIAAYRSPHVKDVVPGLRAVIEACESEPAEERVRTVLAFLAGMASPFDVIEADA